MTNSTRIAKSSFLLGLIGILFGCNGEPRDGLYDRDHHRYYREHSWHECGDRDEHCR
jgi:hypothetical protein